MSYVALISATWPICLSPGGEREGGGGIATFLYYCNQDCNIEPSVIIFLTHMPSCRYVSSPSTTIFLCFSVCFGIIIKFYIQYLLLKKYSLLISQMLYPQALSPTPTLDPHKELNKPNLYLGGGGGGGQTTFLGLCNV